MKFVLLSLLLIVGRQAILAQVSHTCELAQGQHNPVHEAHSINSESPQAGFLGLSSGATQRVSKDIVTTFTCQGKKYGYYADIDNNCHIYHVCHPSKTEFGVDRFTHYSFFCNDGTIFDQENTICVPETNEMRTKCKQSHLHWSTIERKFAEQPPVVEVEEKVIPSTFQQPIVHHIPQSAPVSHDHHVGHVVRPVHHGAVNIEVGKEVVPTHHTATAFVKPPVQHSAMAFSNAPVCCFLVPSCSNFLPTACPQLSTTTPTTTTTTHASNTFVRHVLPSHPIVAANSGYIRPAARVTHA